MSRFSGPQGKGALVRHRATKREQATARAARALEVAGLRHLAAQALRDAAAHGRVTQLHLLTDAPLVITAAGVFADGKRVHR